VRPRVLALAVALAVALLGAGCGGPRTPAPSPTPGAPAGDGLVDVGAGLRGPEGVTATLYAAGVPKMAALATDPEGRLWIATADYRDTGADGVYLVAGAGATPAAVIPGLHTALGLLWQGDELYVSSTERVDAYGGFDGTRFARQRTVVTFPAGSGQNGGLVLAPDGRVQLGISAPCDHCVPESEWSATVVSFNPDGSDLRVDARGIRAPIALAYVPGTDDLLVTMNHRDDLGDATPGDWLGHVEAGQDWGFPDCPGPDPAAGGCAGIPEPVAVLDPHAAVSGLALVDGGAAAVVAEWKLGKVQRVDLATHQVTPFLTGLESPEPVTSTADGALLVGDWGTGKVFRVTM
jgi:glucose/arabinose dehydrogenase